MNLTQKIDNAIEKYRMLDNVKSVLVGFSGGADSTLLLTVLSKRTDIKVYAAHVNHMIRGDEANRDESFAKNYCEKIGVPFFSACIDVPKLSKEGKIGIEEAARNARYDYFACLCEKLSIDKIAVAHNADDNAETILYNLCRGASLNGLCGIKAIRGNIIRPLIFCSKTEIIDYCNIEGIPFVTDSTNADTHYRRNYLRNEIIPSIKAINPNLIDALTRMSCVLEDDENYLSAMAEEYSFESGRTVLSSLPSPILRRIIVSSLIKEGISPENHHILEVEELIKSDKVKGKISIPGGELTIDRDLISCSQDTPTEYDVILKENDATTRFGRFIIAVSEEERSKAEKLMNVYNSCIEGSFNCDIINHVLSVTSRKDGDLIHSGGMTKKVRKILQSKKMTDTQKNRIPILRIDNKILWIPGISISDEFKPEKEKQIKIYFFGDYNESIT